MARVHFQPRVDLVTKFDSFYSIREAFPSASSVQTTHREPNDFSNFVRNLCRSEAADLDGACGTHIATSYDDTTEGAVHIFQDENGQWMSYTFDERGSGVAVNVEAMARRKETPLNAIEEHNKNTSCASLRLVLVYGRTFQFAVEVAMLFVMGFL